MVDNKRLLEIDNRLKQIQAIKSSAEESSTVSKDKRLSQIDERLAQINKLKQKEEPSNGYSDFSPALELRGAVKTVGGIFDLAKSISPESAFNPNLSEDEQRSIIDIKNKERLEHPEDSKRDKFVEYFDEISGNKGDPSGTLGQFRQKIGEFAVPIIPGGAAIAAKTAPAIAAVSQGLRELGLDESYSDLVSAIGFPNFKALSNLSGKVLKKLGDYVATVGNKEYRRAGNVEKLLVFLSKKLEKKIFLKL